MNADEALAPFRALEERFREIAFELGFSTLRFFVSPIDGHVEVLLDVRDEPDILIPKDDPVEDIREEINQDRKDARVADAIRFLDGLDDA